MNTIDALITKAIKIATSPFNHVYAPTRGALMNLNITTDGPVVIKNELIVVPIDIFRFSTFKSEKVRVVLDRDTLKIKEVLAN